MLSGIDQVNVLQKGTVDQVKRATEQTIRTGKPGGGFILQPVDFWNMARRWKISKPTWPPPASTRRIEERLSRRRCLRFFNLRFFLLKKESHELVVRREIGYMRHFSQREIVSGAMLMRSANSFCVRPRRPRRWRILRVTRVLSALASPVKSGHQSRCQKRLPRTTGIC